MTEKKFSAVQKYLKKKNERVIIDLVIKDYDKSNFYLALVFNKKIEKFKVLFIPIDVMEINRVEEYCCYQFMEIVNVNYFLETLNSLKATYQDEEFRNRLSKTLKAYYIEVNINFSGEYKFLTNQVIPEDWSFLFDIIVSLFEHAPNIVSELCNKILALFNDSFTNIKYDYSLDINIDKDNLGIFTDNELTLGKKLLEEVTFFEKIEDKYFAYINNNLFIYEINNYKGIFNVFMNNKNIDKAYLYTLYCLYKEKSENKFPKIIMDNEKYLVYDITENDLLVVSKKTLIKLAIKDVFSTDLEMFDINDSFKDKLIEVINSNFEKDMVDKIIKRYF